MDTQRSAEEQPPRLRERAAEEIRVILARRKMSAARLATQMGVGQTYLSRRMTGEVPLDLDDLEVIARELGVSVVELLGGGPQHTVAKVTGAVRLTEGQLKVRPAVPVQIPGMRRPARIETDLSAGNPSFGSHDLVA